MQGQDRLLLNPASCILSSAAVSPFFAIKHNRGSQTMRLDKFTLKVQEALQVAQRRAETLKSAQLEPEHLLEALAWQEDGVVAPLLKKLGVSIDSHALRTRPAFLLATQSRRETALSFTKAGCDFPQAEKEADQFKDEYVSTEHLLLALAASDGLAGELLRRQGANKDRHPQSPCFDQGRPAGDRSECRREIPGAKAICARSDRPGPSRQTGSGDRTGR